MTQKELEKIFEAGIDGNSCNAYARVAMELQFVHGFVHGEEKITGEQLFKALINCSKKWEKEIDKAIG